MDGIHDYESLAAPISSQPPPPPHTQRVILSSSGKPELAEATPSSFGNSLPTSVSTKEQEENRAATQHFIEVATNHFGEAVMNFACPMAEQQSMIVSASPLHLSRVTEVLSRAAAASQAAKKYATAHPELENKELAHTLGIFEYAQQELNKIIQAEQQTPSPDHHLYEALNHSLAALHNMAQFSALMTGAIFATPALLKAIPPAAMNALAAGMAASPNALGAAVTTTAYTAHELELTPLITEPFLGPLRRATTACFQILASLNHYTQAQAENMRTKKAQTQAEAAIASTSHEIDAVAGIKKTWKDVGEEE